VRVHVRAEKGYERNGQDLYTETHINFAQATLGDKIEIETLDGVKKLVIPEGTQSHQKFRLKNLGIPHLRGGVRGDQYVVVIVDVPKKISRKGRKLLEDLGEEL